MQKFVVSAIALAACLSCGAVQASIIETSTNVVPGDKYVAPTSVMGSVRLNQTGSLSGQYASPFSDTTSAYVAVQNGAAEYAYGSLFNTVSFVWGSPDFYNTVYLYNNGTQLGSISGSVIGSSSTNYFVTLTSSLGFNRVDFFSGQSAFEFSNVQVAAVPLPAGFLLFASGLLALGVFGFARKSGKTLISDYDGECLSVS